jgi:queuine/archaeosine tRNA-ribosyltransferase
MIMGQLVNFCAGAELNVLPARHMDAMLINVPNDACSDSAIKSTKRMLKAANPFNVMLDSGGFQLHVGERDGKKITFDEDRPLIRNKSEINIAPVLVMKPAAIIKPNIVVGLDFPIKKADPSEQKMEFMRKLGFNVVWTKECFNLWKKLCPDIQFFVPIQCYDLIQLDQFISLIPGVEYNGFSMPVRNLTDKGIILFMVRFYQMGVRQVHILGTSKISVIAITAYTARHFFDWVSFDATTWRLWAEKSLYMNPYNLLQSRIAPDVKIDPSIPMDCECPFCRGKTFTFIKNLPDTDRTAFLRGHNWWVIEKATRDLYQNANNVIALERCLRARGVKSRAVDDLCNALSLADSLKDSDIRVLQGLFG